MTGRLAEAIATQMIQGGVLMLLAAGFTTRDALTLIETVELSPHYGSVSDASDLRAAAGSTQTQFARVEAERAAETRTAYALGERAGYRSGLLEGLKLATH